MNYLQQAFEKVLLTKLTEVPNCKENIISTYVGSSILCGGVSARIIHGSLEWNLKVKGVIFGLPYPYPPN